MTSEDQFIQQLRSSLQTAVAHAEPPPDLLVRVTADLKSGRRIPKRAPASIWTPRTLHLGLRAIPMVLAIGTTVAIAAAALVLLGRQPTHPSSVKPAPAVSPPLGSPDDPATRYAVRAVRKANRSQACSTPPPVKPRQGPIIGHVVPKELSSVLGVLRRPKSSDDEVRSLIHDPVVQSNAQVVYLNDMRLALTSAGYRYYLLPITTRPRPDGVSRACAAERQTALRHNKQIPNGLRRRALQALAAITAQERYDSKSHPAVCELVIAPRGGSGSTCTASARQISQSGTLNSSQLGRGAPQIAAGVVPDGVATVTVRFTASHGRSPITITVRPTDNVFALKAPGYNSGESAQTIIWRSKTGSIIKTISASQAQVI